LEVEFACRLGYDTQRVEICTAVLGDVGHLLSESLFQSGEATARDAHLAPNNAKCFLEVLDLFLGLHREGEELESGLHEELLYPIILWLRGQH